MGTQFSSRLSVSDCTKIKTGLREVRDSVLRQAPKGKAGRKSVKKLSAERRRSFGDKALGKVLSVAEDRGFSDEFAASTEFRKILTWLKSLQNDAAFNGFQGIVKKYSLDSSGNVTADLVGILNDLVSPAENSKPGPFHTAAMSAAKAILAEVHLISDKSDSGDSEAVRFGKKLARMTIKEIVRKYVSSFITEVVLRVMDRADPAHSERPIQDARQEAIRAARRMADRAVNDIVRKGVLASDKEIHDIVVEKIGELTRKAS